MTAGQELAAWAELRAWVTWLHDRYELSTEDRLPRCWPAHPGLVEELTALKAWREEIYAAEQPSGQAARYWHAELRTILHAAATMYAVGCRTGHRGAPAVAADDDDLRSQWALASPLAGVPPADLAAGQARAAGHSWASHAEVSAALDDGQARPIDVTGNYLTYAGHVWMAAGSGWVTVTHDQDATTKG